MPQVDHTLSKVARRRRRVRAQLLHRTDRPRLTVFRSGKHIYAQIILKGVTLASASDANLDAKLKPVDKASQVGSLIAKAALAKKITTVAFDRGSYQYHGRVKAVAEAARAAGLKL